MKLHATIAFASLALIGIGAYQIMPAAAPLVVGALLWFDLTIGSLKR